MKKPILALIMAAGILAAKSASALTYDSYLLHGNSCTSITSGRAPVVSRWGPYAPGASAINVSCPIILPSKSKYYTSAWMMVLGYNRNSVDKLSCTIGSTDYVGTNPVAATATLPDNASDPQFDAVTIYPASNQYGNATLYITCHLPAATGSRVSHLSSIILQVGY